MIESLDHINIETTDLGKSIRFYSELLGLKIGSRPAFDVDGAWLYARGEPIIHLVVRNEVSDGPTGAINHVALRARGREEYQRRLDAMGIEYRVVVVPDLNVIQLFIVDPNQVRLELNFYREPENLPAEIK